MPTAIASERLGGNASYSQQEDQRSAPVRAFAPSPSSSSPSSLRRPFPPKTPHRRFACESGGGRNRNRRRAAGSRRQKPDAMRSAALYVFSSARTITEACARMQFELWAGVTAAWHCVALQRRKRKRDARMRRIAPDAPACIGIAIASTAAAAAAPFELNSRRVTHASHGRLFLACDRQLRLRVAQPSKERVLPPLTAPFPTHHSRRPTHHASVPPAGHSPSAFHSFLRTRRA